MKISEDIVIRSTVEADWQALKAIRLAALLEAPTAFGVTHAEAMAYSEDQWRERAGARGRARFILAFKNQVAIGMVGYVPNPVADANLIAMWVTPEERGTDVAESLVQAVKMEVAAQSCSSIVLEVSPENRRAASFYQKQGFAFLPEWEPLASHPGIQLQKMQWLNLLEAARLQQN